MKTKVAYVFVDDGEPEASDYANHFIAFAPAIPGSLGQAMARAGMGPWKPVTGTAGWGSRLRLLLPGPGWLAGRQAIHQTACQWLPG